MEKIKQLLRPSLVVAAFAALAGCGGHTASPSSAMIPPPGASPTPSANPTPGTPVPSNAQVIADIQKLTGWQTCTNSCSGTAPAVFSMAQAIAAPSLSGSSARFQLLPGTHPFGGVLWFEFLGAHNNATHFVYDLNFYVDNPAAAQAIEFNVTQSDGKNRYSFSTQCFLMGGHVWRVWDPAAGKWAGTGVTCAQPPANTWNHLIWEFERDSGGNVIFTAVTMNGTREVVNLSMPHTADSSNGVDVSYQSDANLKGTPYSVWLDKVNLTFW